MPPPCKSEGIGDVKIHACHIPLSTPLSFVGPTSVVCTVGSSICLWNVAQGTREFIHTTSHSITKVCASASTGLLAYCEGGTSPQVYVYNTIPRRSLLFQLSDVTELELADLAFSRCGSRLYALSRATTKKLQIFSMKSGKLLPGCDVALPQRFDKVSIFQGHKDKIALVRSSGVRIVCITKSYKTYIVRLLPSALPTESDLAVSAYAWTNSGNFLVASRQGALLTLDGSNGSVLNAVQAMQPITTLVITPEYLVTAHVGNIINFWNFEPRELSFAEDNLEAFQRLQPMEDESGYILKRSADLEGMCLNMLPEKCLMGQVAYLQVTPGNNMLLVTTVEGEVWKCQMPSGSSEKSEESNVQEVEYNDDVSTDLDLSILTWFHTHPVSDLLVLDSAGRIVASCDEGGRLRIWQLTRGSDSKGLRTLCFTSALSTMCFDPDGSILVVGTDTGCVHKIGVQHWKNAHIAESLRICDTAIAKMCCKPTSDGIRLWVAAALFDNRVAFFVVPRSGGSITMYGFVDFRGLIQDICFNSKVQISERPCVFAVGKDKESGSHCVWSIQVPPVNYEVSTEELGRDKCPVSSLKLSAPENLEDEPTSVIHLSERDAVGVGFASGVVKTYTVPNSIGLPTTKTIVTPAGETLLSHSQVVTALHLAAHGRRLISCAMDGCVMRTSLISTVKGQKVEKAIHNPYNGGVTQVSSDEAGDMFFSSGGSDGVIVWSDPTTNVKTPASTTEEDAVVEQLADAVVNINDHDTTEFPKWAPISKKEQEERADENDDPELNALSLAQRRSLTLEVENLRKKLRLLVDQNAAVPELEQLGREEFCIDLEEKELIAAKSKDRCDLLRAQIERENVARQLIRHRLIKEFWDPMRGKGCQIDSLCSNLSVSNYPERTVSEEEKIRIKKLRLLRQGEQLENQFLKSTDCPAKLGEGVLLKAEEFATGKEGYVVNWWHTGSIDVQKDNPASDQKYLYEPFELLTGPRRRLQIYLLQSLAAEYRQSFNELFKTCQGDKNGIMDQIREKATRARAILAELQVEETIDEPVLGENEDADAVLDVKGSEIKAEKWISPEERLIIEEAKAKEEARLRKLRENDAGQRAIIQMMGGTLKTKKDLTALEITLDKELWMDEIPEEDMTDVQLAAVKEFHEKEKTLAEEQEKYRKQLDAETKRCKAEMSELTQTFENVLKELHNQRFAHDAKFFCQELYCIRLQLALLQNVEDNLVLKQALTDLGNSRQKVADTNAALEEFNAQVVTKKTLQDERVKKEKELSSAQNFRTLFTANGLEPEQVAALLALFRKRPGKTGGGGGRLSTTITAIELSSTLHSVAPDADPYADLGVQPESNSNGFAGDEDVFLEMPEGVDEVNFHRMLELRQEKLQAEQEVQTGAAELQEMSSFLSYLQSERDEAASVHKMLQNELEEHADLMKREEFDIEILFKLKQGQVEVPQAAVVTDYSDAVVIDTEVVEKRNRRILEIGKDKVGTLETIKEFRKKLSLIQWEYKMLQMQTLDLEERTKDVHMLRVTKGLQSLLKGGEEGRNKADADLLERKIEHLNSTIAQKEAAMKKQYSASSQATKARKNENTMLEKKLRELQQNVIQREHIRRLRAPQGGSPQGGAQDGDRPKIIGGGGRIVENEVAIRAAQTGFREVKTRQALMELAKKHTAELDVLTKELDRLRQKTFPSFVSLNDDRGPDQR